MSISCLVVDDEPLAVQLLENHISLTPGLQLRHVCYSALEALEWLKTNRVDLIFLDINLPHLSGMQLKTLLPPEQNVIFTTAYADYAVASYEQNAVDYLLKPITLERFLKAVQKVRAQAVATVEMPASPDAYVFIKSGKELIKVAYEEVLLIEALKDYVLVITPTARIITQKRIRELEQQLPPQFSRIHLSYIVNRNHISRIANNHVWVGGKAYPLSESYREAFLREIEQKRL